MLHETMTTGTLMDVVERMLHALDRGAPPNEFHMLFCAESQAWPGPPMTALGHQVPTS